MGLLSGLLGGGGTQTVKTAPWEAQQPFLKRGFSLAQNLLSRPDFTAPEIQGQQMALDYAGSLSPIISGTRGALNFSLSPEILSPDTNPYLAQYAQAATRPVIDTLKEQVLPSIGRSAVASGQYGGSRQGIAEGLAMGKAAQAIADANAKIYSQAYGQGLDQMTRGLQLAPSVAGLGLMPASIFQQIGRQQYARPWETAGNYMGLVSGNYGGTQTTPTGNPLGALVGLGGGLLVGKKMLGLSGGDLLGAGALGMSAGGLFG